MTEKKMWVLSVDDELRDLIPPLSAEERQMLEESIIANGCEMPILVWNNTVVDGHNRYDICHKHSIPFAIQEREFGTRLDAELWMLRNQLGRRNLNDYLRSEMVLKLKETLADAAAMRKRAGVKSEEAEQDLGAILHQGPSVKKNRQGRTYTQMGKMAGVSENTLRKVEKLVEKADDDTKGKLRRGEVSIHHAYKDIVQQERAGETRVCARCHALKPLVAFSMHSNRANFSAMCKDCEREVDEAAKAAAKVASDTTEPVETYPVQGMAMYKGHPIHVGSAPEDKPEMFSHVQGLLEFSVHGYLADVREAMKWFGPNMRTPENVKMVEELIQSAYEGAMAMLHDEHEEEK